MRPRTGDSSEAVISWAWISHPAPASGTMETPPPARWRGGGGGGGHRPLIPTRPRRPARTASPARARHPPAPPSHARRPGCLPTPPGAGHGPRTRGVFQRWSREGGGTPGASPRGTAEPYAAHPSPAQSGPAAIAGVSHPAAATVGPAAPCGRTRWGQPCALTPETPPCPHSALAKPGTPPSPTGHTPPRATALPGRRFAGTSRAGCCPDVPSVPRRAHPRVPAGSLAGGRASERARVPCAGQRGPCQPPRHGTGGRALPSR